MVVHAREIGWAVSSPALRTNTHLPKPWCVIRNAGPERAWEPRVHLPAPMQECGMHLPGCTEQLNGRTGCLHFPLSFHFPPPAGINRSMSIGLESSQRAPNLHR